MQPLVAALGTVGVCASSGFLPPTWSVCRPRGASSLSLHCWLPYCLGVRAFKLSVMCSDGNGVVKTEGLQPSRLLCRWDCPGEPTGVGCHCLLRGIFLTQGLNLCLLHCRQVLDQ